MQPTISRRRWTTGMLVAAAVVLLGLALALTGGGGPFGSNKADAYGTAPAPATTLAGCKLQGTSTERAPCIARVLRTRARARCATKAASKRAACRTAANTAYARNLKRGKACLTTFNRALPSFPDNPSVTQINGINARIKALTATADRCFGAIR